jgi:hypothetical protein
MGLVLDSACSRGLYSTRLADSAGSTQGVAPLKEPRFGTVVAGRSRCTVSVLWCADINAVQLQSLTAPESACVQRRFDQSMEPSSYNPRSEKELSMARSNSTQHKLDRVRPPRVHVT